MLSPAQGIHHGSGFGANAGCAVGIIDFEKVFRRHAGDARYILQGVAGIVLFHQLKHAARVLQRFVLFWKACVIHLERPGFGVVFPGLGIKTAEQTILE